jgi:hypothetical protein
MSRPSRGARLCAHVIRQSRPRKGGLRRCGRSLLANRLGCSVRTVSRYLVELREAGELEVIPPRRVWTPTGWRTVECNGYRLPPSRRRLPRSRRGDTAVTPPPSGARATCSAATSPAPPHVQSDGAAAPTANYPARLAEVRALMAAHRHKRPR